MVKRTLNVEVQRFVEFLNKTVINNKIKKI